MRGQDHKAPSPPGRPQVWSGRYLLTGGVVDSDARGGSGAFCGAADLCSRDIAERSENRMVAIFGDHICYDL